MAYVRANIAFARTNIAFAIFPIVPYNSLRNLLFYSLRCLCSSTPIHSIVSHRRYHDSATIPEMSSAKKIAPYGTWTSPITTEIVSGSSLSFNEVHVNVSYPAFSLRTGLTST